MSMLISAVLATANIVMTPKRPIGKPGAPASTTCSSGVSPSLSRSAGTSAMAEIDAGEHHVGLDALADATVVDECDQRHEAQADEGDADALPEVQTEDLRGV